jgi:predicted transcriptional regulator
MMDDNRKDALITLCMLKLRFQNKLKVNLTNIQEKTKELENMGLDEQSIITSIQRLRDRGHIKDNSENLLLGSGIVYHYIEILQYEGEVNIEETLDILENRIRHYTEHRRYDL